jgi:hypothetical protein
VKPLRGAILLTDPLPVSQLTALVNVAQSLLGEDAVFDSNLAARMGVRFALRSKSFTVGEDPEKAAEGR